MLGALAFLVIGIAWRHVSAIEMGDFKVVYYSARTLLAHGDPYNEQDVLRVYHAEGRERSTEPVLDRQVKTRFFYPPTAFLFTLPFAVLGFSAGSALWTIFLAGGLILAAIASWDLAADAAPLLAGILAGLVLLNSFWLFMIGNAAAIAVTCCVLAVWCFWKKRFEPAGVLLLAISLALKPNDSGLIWLFLVLSSASLRKRALQSLAVLAILSVPILIWVTHIAPHWYPELKTNMASFSGISNIVDPAATGMAGKNMDCLVQLQAAISIFIPRPETYNLVTWLVCTPLLIWWLLLSLRTRSDRTSDRSSDRSTAWLVLAAAAAPLSMLPTYHFQHDAKLLLLAIPACAILWARRGLFGWAALLITSAAIIVNGDIFTGIRILLTKSLLVPHDGFGSHLLTMILTRPGPLVLLATAIFYLWAARRLVRLDKNAAEPEPGLREKSAATSADAKARVLKGQRLSRTALTADPTGTVLKGHGFSRAERPPTPTRALAPEGSSPSRLQSPFLRNLLRSNCSSHRRELPT
jgi:hypothetical protein